MWRMADPPRRGAASRPAARRSARRPVAALRRRIASGPPSPWSSCGATLLVYASASSQHAITWLVEERGFAFPRAAFLSAAIVLGGGLAGNLVIGVAHRPAARRLDPGARLVALGLLGGLGLAAAATFYRVSPASPLFYPAWFLAQAWLLGWYGAAVAAIDEMAPPGLRASVLGFGLLVVNLVGVASGAVRHRPRRRPREPHRRPDVEPRPRGPGRRAASSSSASPGVGVSRGSSRTAHRGVRS